MWEFHDYWEVAVYWPQQGYGGSTTFKSREKAISEVKHLTDEHRFAEVHIHHVTTSKAEVFKRLEKVVDAGEKAG